MSFWSPAAKVETPAGDLTVCDRKWATSCVPNEQLQLFRL